MDSYTSSVCWVASLVEASLATFCTHYSIPSCHFVTSRQAQIPQRQTQNTQKMGTSTHTNTLYGSIWAHVRSKQQTFPLHKHTLKQHPSSLSFLDWRPWLRENKIRFIVGGRQEHNKIVQIIQWEKPECMYTTVCTHESVCVCASTKPCSEKETREMPSEPGAWEARCHIILEEMHRQQREARCNTLMNKYGEGWNWSLVLSGGGKKNNKDE